MERNHEEQPHCQSYKAISGKTGKRNVAKHWADQNSIHYPTIPQITTALPVCIVSGSLACNDSSSKRRRSQKPVPVGIEHENTLYIPPRWNAKVVANFWRLEQYLYLSHVARILVTLKKGCQTKQSTTGLFNLKQQSTVSASCLAQVRKNTHTHTQKR